MEGRNLVLALIDEESYLAFRVTAQHEAAAVVGIRLVNIHAIAPHAIEVVLLLTSRRNSVNCTGARGTRKNSKTRCLLQKKGTHSGETVGENLHARYGQSISFLAHRHLGNETSSCSASGMKIQLTLFLRRYERLVGLVVVIDSDFSYTARLFVNYFYFLGTVIQVCTFYTLMNDTRRSNS